MMVTESCPVAVTIKREENRTRHSEGPCVPSRERRPSWDIKPDGVLVFSIDEVVVVNEKLTAFGPRRNVSQMTTMTSPNTARRPTASPVAGSATAS